MMIGRSMPLLLALVAAAAVLLARGTDAHAFLSSPRSRVLAAGRGWGEYDASAGNGLGPRPFPLYPDGTFVSDKPDECGDPHQDSSSFFIKSIETPVQATYASGSEISITITVRAQHGGYFMLKVCPTTVNPTQSCFDSFPATVSGTSYTRWWIQSSQYTYTIRWRLPNVEASGSSGRRYVMQLTYRTANSCVDQCSAAECGDGYAAQYSRVIGLGPLPVCGTNGAAPRTEIFKDCSDIFITGGGGSGPTPSPVTVKPSPVTVTPSPVTATPSPVTAPGPCTSPPASTFCAGKAPGLYGDKCKACNSFYNCWNGGAVYQQCGVGTAMDSRGGTVCNWPANIVC